MTPQEKATQLVDKYIPYTRVFKETLGWEDDKASAKQCALISIEFAREFITGDLSESFDKTMYLFEIKQEIEKL